MAGPRRRRNEPLLKMVVALGFALVTGSGLIAMRFAPQWGVLVLALAAGAGAFVAPSLGVAVAVVALALPLLAANPVAGVIFLIVGLAATRYLAADGGRAFLVIGLSFVGAAFGPLWAAAAVAGVVMGATDGAIAAAIAALVVELAGIALGLPAFGSGALVHSGGSVALLGFAKQPHNMFALTWMVQRITALKPSDVGLVSAAFRKLTGPVALVLQPLAWAVGALVAGYTRKALVRRTGATWASLAGACAGVAVIAAASYVALAAVGLRLGAGALGIAAAESLVLAGLVAAGRDALFPVIPPVAPGQGTAALPATVATEDADVDELLRLISEAEDKLTTEHTTNAIVMLTDMKSFSKMTEEDGSVVTAKAIQRHRDLLLPIIEAHNGHGKSTGGDGLVAAFQTAPDALKAAAEMQKALADYNASHADERDILVRCGLAQGEVVLDKGGRPFIGVALNMAARVMNLADGGQVYCTGYVASAASDAGLQTASHGTFELKNIAKPIEVFELLWHESQQPFLPAAGA